MKRDLPLVVSSGLCVGCGACAVAEPEHLSMELTSLGTYLPTPRSTVDLGDLPGDVLTRASSVCPFSDGARNEDSIGSELYEKAGVAHDEVLGYYRKIVAGHVSADDYRAAGTSGGMTSWVLARLLAEGHVDGVIHVASTMEGLPNPLSRYRISRTVADLLGGRKSRYHVQTLTEVMLEVKEVPGRYAVVGVPCFIKAARLLADADAVINERLVFTASLFCGHLKSTLYSDYLSWSVGVEPTDVRDIDYRHKEPGRPPNRYCSKIEPVNGPDVVRGSEQIPMADWGIGLFKLGACDCCDDVGGEVADMSLGDAWLPPFMSDWRGANVAVARSAKAEEILSSGERSGDLTVVPWTAEDVVASQAGAVRHRRAGLAVRLGDRARRGVWAPRKRVSPLPPEKLSTPFATRMLHRHAIAVASGPAYLRAKERRDLRSFVDEMRPYLRRYDGSRSSTIWRRGATWLVQRLPARAETGLRSFARQIGL